MKEEILILVKTYPTFSKKYYELVCTAGINKDKQWRRIYPIPFRQLDEIEKYKKYQWVEVDIEKYSPDKRPESYKLKSGTDIKIIKEALDTHDNWRKRKEVVFENTPVFHNLSEIIHEAHQDRLSLCMFKPTKILDFLWEETEREWPKNILTQIRAANDQMSFFPEIKKEIKLVKKLPYKFSYSFEDAEGKPSTLMIEDWEIGQLYWNCLERHNNNESKAIQDVIKKYRDTFLKKKDLTFFLGTTLQFHRRKSNNPFIIIGVFYPPKDDGQIDILTKDSP